MHRAWSFVTLVLVVMSMGRWLPARMPFRCHVFEVGSMWIESSGFQVTSRVTITYYLKDHKTGPMPVPFRIIQLSEG